MYANHSADCSCAICIDRRENARLNRAHNHDHNSHAHENNHKHDSHADSSESTCGCGHDYSHEHVHAHTVSEEDTCGCGHNHSHEHVHAHAVSVEDTCGCGHDHSHTHDHAHAHEGCSCESGTETLDKIILGRILIGAVLLAAGVFLDLGQGIKLAFYFISLAIVGYDIIFRAVSNLIRKLSLDENLLMSIACIGAFCIGEYAEGVLVMLLYQIGELFQGYAVGNSRKSIRSLVDLRPETVNVMNGMEIQTIAAEGARVGDIIVVKPGERIALDGIVIEGETTLDTSALTGESLARNIGIGEKVLSGCVNLTSLIKIEVTAELSQSAVSKIMALVEEAADKKAEPEKFITRFAKVYTPIVFIAAIIVAIIPPLFFGQEWYDWIYRSLTFLVISCPCALVISVPLSYFAGIGGASKKGILFKGSNSMDVMSRVKTVVFDKTGTLTTGQFQVTEIKPAHGVSREVLLELAAHVEVFSDHPLARSIVSAYGKEIDNSRISESSEKRGKGVNALVDGNYIIAGNKAYMDENKINVSSFDASSSTTIYVASDGELLGYIALGDTNKKDSVEAIDRLKSSAINSVMLTGDNSEAAARTANSLGIDEYHAECMPEDKSNVIQTIMDGASGTVAFVGDGINDAPVLAMADVGVAMGGLGSDAAIEAADVVIVNDEPSKIVTALNSAGRTKSIVVQNITFALAVKGLFLVLGALGYSAMATAIFADVGVSLLAILNSMRAAK